MALQSKSDRVNDRGGGILPPLFDKQYVMSFGKQCTLEELLKSVQLRVRAKGDTDRLDRKTAF